MFELNGIFFNYRKYRIPWPVCPGILKTQRFNMDDWRSSIRKELLRIKYNKSIVATDQEFPLSGFVKFGEPACREIRQTIFCGEYPETIGFGVQDGQPVG